MPTTTAPPPPPAAAPSTLAPTQQYIDQQIRRTRRGLKFIDFLSGAITLVIGLLVFLLAAAMIDHWLIPGGLGRIGRSVLFGVLAVGALWFVVALLLTLLRPINPVFAAKTIEAGSPTLKNSLLNLLLFRGHRGRMSNKVYQAIEEQAAQRLSETSLEGVIDRTAVLRLGYVLAAVVALCALYRVLSPKDPAVTAGRVLAPWADIAPPSRVQILDVEPGNASLARGERLAVSAEVLGVADDEPVRLHYSTIDQQLVDEQTNMVRSAGGVRYEGQLPPRGRRRAKSTTGIEQALVYWIEAGDARSREFEVAVYSRPTLVVTGLRYEYPAYTGYPSEQTHNTGDVRGLEGTRVTIEAVANQPIKSAHVDFDADGRRDLPMQVDGDKATATFELQLRDDRRTPQHGKYVLRLVTTAGRENREPPVYRIEVTPDYAPEVRIVAPEAEEIELRVDESARLAVEARDPDFVLRQVQLAAKVGQRDLLLGDLLREPHAGRFDGSIEFSPADANLKPGDVIEYWASAEDNRRPESNRAESGRQRIRVVEPNDRRLPPQDPQQQQQDDQKNQGDPQNEDGREQGEQGAGGTAGGEGEGEADAQQNPGAQGARQQSQQGDQQQDGAGGIDGEGENEDPQDGQPDSAGVDGGASEAGEKQPNPDNRNEAGEKGDDASGAQRDEQRPQEKLSAEGDEDGQAIERMAEHFKNQQNDAGENAGDEQPGDPASAGTDRNEDSDARNQSEQDQQVQDQQVQGEEPTDANQADREQPGAEAGDERGVDQRPGEAPSPSSEQAASDAQDGERGANDANQPKPEGEGSDVREQPGEPAGDEGMANRNQGESGGGDEPGEPQGAPGADPKQPRDKPDQPGEPVDTGDDPAAPAESKGQTESDAQSSQSGDRSGGGEEGAGQQADAQGQGGAGENTPSDEGGGASDEPGEGESTADRGKPSDQQSESPTGNPSEQQQPGEGSQQTQDAGERPGGEQSAAGEDASDAQAGEPGAAGEGTSASDDPPQAGGQPGAANGDSNAADDATMPGDDPNLEFARQQTDLVLNKLDDQLDKQQVDQNLLEKLGWSNQDLQRFVDRWKGLKDQAAADSQGEQQLNDALRKLGLRRQGPRRFRAAAEADRLRDLNEAYRNRIPLKYREPAKAYVKGVAAGADE